MSQEDGAGVFIEYESEEEYLDRKMKEYLATRERNIRKIHFDYSRKK